MKIKFDNLSSMIREAITEAKKKKADDDMKPEDRPVGYVSDEKFDMSKPLGNDNLYKKQGASGMGPFTEEKALRLIVRKLVSEAYGEEEEEEQEEAVQRCEHVFNVPEGTIWEGLSRLSEATCDKCGSPIREKHLGFAKLKRKLAHKKGVKNAGALAASIGRKKYGAKKMAKMAAAGKKK